MTAFGTLCNSLPRPSSDEKSWIGITDAENLHKVGGSIKRLNQAQALLWKGQVDETLALFEECQKKQAQNFCQYLRSPSTTKASITIIFRHNSFAPLAPVQSNLPSSRLTVVSKSLERSGTLKTFHKSLPIAALTSMG